MVSFAEFVKVSIGWAEGCPIKSIPVTSLRVWVEEQIEVLDKEIEVLEGMPNSVQYHDEVIGRMFQIKFCKEMLEGLK
jgi:hypothetical protein